MRISVFAVEANPSIDLPFIRRSLCYCQTEVDAGRARQLEGDIRRGIQLLPVNPKPSRTEYRGSPEAHGPLTAAETRLNADYQGDESDVSLLAGEYEHHLDKHIERGFKGTPRQCSVIAAHVKTVLSEPTFRVAPRGYVL